MHVYIYGTFRFESFGFYTIALMYSNAGRVNEFGKKMFYNNWHVKIAIISKNKLNFLKWKLNSISRY